MPCKPITGESAMSKKQLGATLFPITGLPGQAFRLRVLRVREAIPMDTQTPVRLNRWATQLWKELKQAVVPTGRFEWPAFLTPDVESLIVGSVLTVQDVPDREYSIEVTTETVEVVPASANAEELQLAGEMIKRAISDAFGRSADKYWRKNWNLYFRLEPENWEDKRDKAYAYRGLKFGVVFLSDVPWLAADILTTYRGQRPLSDYSGEQRQRELYDHLSERIEVDDRAMFLRDNGKVKITCRFAGVTGKTVVQYTFPINGGQKSVREYYKERYGILVPENDEVVFVRDREDGDSWPVPASRLYPLFTTEYDEVRNCSVVPQMSPDERLSTIRAFLKNLDDVRFAGSKLAISPNPFQTAERSVFPAPTLEFGNGQTLLVNASLPVEEGYNQYRQGKMTMLYEHGPFSGQSLPDLVLLYPDNLDRNVREKLHQRIGEEIRELCGVAPRIARQVSYPLGKQPHAGAGLLAAADDLVRNNDGTFLPVIVLADALREHVYDLLKRRLSSLASQCVRERTVVRVVRDEQAVGGSRLRNLALGILTAAGLQPWVLAKPLHYDFYMGVDVLANQVIYVFVCGKGGRNVWVQRGEQLRRRGLTEKIDRIQLTDQFKIGVREAKRLGVPLNSLIVHRDGRWWSNEDLAITEAVAELQGDGTLSKDCQVGVVEVRKSHLPVRLFNVLNGGSDSLENPMPGSHLVLNTTEAILTPTGQPGRWDRQGRTAATLLLRIARNPEGFPLDIRKIAEDAYGLTHLNWNAPDIEISLPVTIRWSDERLREIVTNPSATDDAEVESQEVCNV
jgi:hypothetical protein